MPIDYNSILETIQQELINYYAHNPHPRGNGKSTQFEKAVEKIAKSVFAMMSLIFKFVFIDWCF